MNSCYIKKDLKLSQYGKRRYDLSFVENIGVRPVGFREEVDFDIPSTVPFLTIIDDQTRSISEGLSRPHSCGLKRASVG